MSKDFSSTSVVSGVEYPLLALFLMDVPTTTDRITVSFGALDSLAGRALPPEALFPEWWEASGVHNPSAWSMAGWEVDFVVPGRAVGFSRTLVPREAY
jgi:hypothetical protein